MHASMSPSPKPAAIVGWNILVAQIVRREIHALHPHHYHLLAYCLMPNHVHLLVDTQDIPQPPPHKDGTRFTPPVYALWLLKGRTAHLCQKRLGRTGRFWSREYSEHLVRDGREYKRILAYIANNPVQAGLARHWQDWPHTFVADHPSKQS